MPHDRSLGDGWNRIATRLRRAVLRRRRLVAFILAALAGVILLHLTRPAPPATVAVVVAAHDLAGGGVLQASDLTTAGFPASGVPDGAAPASAAAGLAGRTMAAPVRRGEPITDLRLIGPTLATAQPGLATLPIRLPDAAMASLLRAGDRLRLLATNPTSGTARVVAEHVIVIAIPEQAPDQAGAATTTGRLVVIGVPENLLTAVTSAATGGFLTYAYDSE